VAMTGLVSLAVEVADLGLAIEFIEQLEDP
jgi:hypothetical protein